MRSSTFFFFFFSRFLWFLLSLVRTTMLPTKKHRVFAFGYSGGQSPKKSPLSSKRSKWHRYGTVRAMAQEPRRCWQIPRDTISGGRISGDAVCPGRWQNYNYSHSYSCSDRYVVCCCCCVYSVCQIVRLLYNKVNLFEMYETRIQNATCTIAKKQVRGKDYIAEPFHGWNHRLRNFCAVPRIRLGL